MLAPPVRFELTHPASEAGALSSELRGPARIYHEGRGVPDGRARVGGEAPCPVDAPPKQTSATPDDMNARTRATGLTGCRSGFHLFRSTATDRRYVPCTETPASQARGPSPEYKDECAHRNVDPKPRGALE